MLLTVTANVAQVFLTDAAWAATLRPPMRRLARVGAWSSRPVIRRRGMARVEPRAVLPAHRRLWSRRRPDVGRDVLGVKGDQVFRSTVVFEADGAVLTSTSTLRFRQGE